MFLQLPPSKAYKILKLRASPWIYTAGKQPHCWPGPNTGIPDPKLSRSFPPVAEESRATRRMLPAEQPREISVRMNDTDGAATIIGGDNSHALRSSRTPARKST